MAISKRTLNCALCGREFVGNSHGAAYQPKFCSRACFAAGRIALQLQQRAAPEELFWRRVGKRGPDECWEWTGARNASGYGVFDVRYERYAHRYSYMLAHGVIPAGQYICHRCDHPPCVNPAHLFAGTPEDNQSDSRAKGRMRKATGLTSRAAKLTPDQVREARAVADGGVSALARRFGVNPTTLWALRHGKTWQHVR